MKRNILYLCAAIFSLLFFNCCAKLVQNNIPKETVIPVGYSVIVETYNGELKIEATSELSRTYTWEGQTIKANLIPRKVRWYGKLGLYHGQLRPPHKNVVHMIVEEYQSHYESIEQFIKYLNKYDNIQDIYNDTGLQVRFRKEISSKGQIAIDITVSQILINGIKPIQLPGSQNSKITMIKNT